jgi:hypothetical protein
MNVNSTLKNIHHSPDNVKFTLPAYSNQMKSFGKNLYLPEYYFYVQRYKKIPFQGCSERVQRTSKNNYYKLSPKSALNCFTSFCGQSLVGSRRPLKKRNTVGSSTNLNPPTKFRCLYNQVNLSSTNLV